MLFKAKLKDTTLVHAKPQFAEIRYSEMKGTRFGTVNMKGANFSHADLEGANFSKAKLQKAFLEEAMANDKTVFLTASLDNVVTVPLAVSPPGGNSWLFSSLLSSFKDDDDDNNGDGADEDKEDSKKQGDAEDNQTCAGDGDFCGFCEDVKETQDGVSEVWEEAKEKMQQALMNKMRKSPVMRKTTYDSLVGLKTILEKNLKDEQVQHALKPLLTGLRDMIKAANKSLHAAVSLPEVLEGMKELLKNIEKRKWLADERKTPHAQVGHSLHGIEQPRDQGISNLPV